MSTTSVLGLRAVSSGKRYLEIELVTYEPFAGDTTNYEFGIYSETANLSAGVNGYGRGSIDHSSLWSPDLPGETPVAGDVLRFWMDLDSGRVWVGVNSSVSGDPVAGTDAINDGVPELLLPSGHEWFANATMQFFDSGNPEADTTTCRLRAKTSQFLLGPGAGWTPWET